MNPYTSLLIMAVLVFLVTVGGLAVSTIINSTRRNRVEVVNYGCGISSTPADAEHEHSPAPPYLVGMAFTIFDVEVVFPYPWATAFGRLDFFGLKAAILFIGPVTVPYALEWRRGGLNRG